jgi:transposase
VIANHSYLRELAPVQALQIMHRGACRVNDDKDAAVISIWRKHGGQLNLNLGGIRGEQLASEYATHVEELSGSDVYQSMNSLAWFPETDCRTVKATGWTKWTRRKATVRYLNAAACDLDFHQGVIPSEKELLLFLEKKREQLGMPAPTLIAFSGQGVWGFWLLVSENGDPVRAWPLAVDNWINLQTTLLTKFGKDLADPRIKDPARLCRIPNSLHSRAGKVVRYYRCELGREYTIGELSSILGVESRQAPKTKRDKTPVKAAAGRARVERLLLGLDQMLGLWNGRVPVGLRRDYLWRYARVMKMNRYPMQAIEDKCIEIGRASGLTDDEVKGQVASALVPSRWLPWERTFEKYGQLCARFRVPHSLIAAWSSPKVDPAARRFAQQQQRDSAFQERARHATSLRDQGLSRKEIAAQLGISDRTAARLLAVTHVPNRSLLVGSDAKHPNTLAAGSLAHFETDVTDRAGCNIPSECAKLRGAYRVALEQRRKIIRDLSSERELSTADLRERLRNEFGIEVSRMTLSRDLRAMKATTISYDLGEIIDQLAMAPRRRIIREGAAYGAA